MDTNNFTALYAAIVSTVALTWNIVRDWNDRGRIKVDAMVGKLVPDNTDKDYLFITITNVGRQPIMAAKWGGMKKKRVAGPRGFVILSRGLPKMLQPGEYHMEYTDDFGAASDDLDYIAVWDSSGKAWHVTKKNRNKVIADALEVMSARN